MIFPQPLLTAINTLYLPAALQCSADYSADIEAREYGGFRFTLDDRQIVFRVAKITPTKVGQFVTLWKRACADGVIAPLDSAVGIDFVVVHVTDEGQSGQFIFDRETLLSLGVMSRSGVGGKRALRVYPPWSKPSARQAWQTQRWQVEYFVPVTPFELTSTVRVRALFHCMP
ncbi:hypothetical protein C1886_11550 [Pseudomonas sp. FW300-N1A1]|uniref:MepB family protein n=1 Tax=Pseudomonas sp. FW300-N1A1 TaxID=2075555 RepID=UPI000CD0FC18|nr:MepB family protein [Pseudomonas sp. FW300-N1A1]POA19654.1 hypothetical protein C1886_11550 [Pseudomonas sp. FW300-N1A1]